VAMAWARGTSVGCSRSWTRHMSSITMWTAESCTGAHNSRAAFNDLLECPSSFHVFSFVSSISSVKDFASLLCSLKSIIACWSVRAPPALHASAPPSDGLVVPRLARLIEITGSSADSPARNVRLSGLTLRHSVPTFCCDHPYESVSGGDWSLHRGGAVFFENVTDSEISDCLLDSPEGNGIVMNGCSLC
jgi:hypothetical protein